MEPQTARKDEREAIKEVQGFEWEGDYRPAAQKAIKEMLEGQMAPWADRHLGEVGSRGGVDRRNGSYHRRLTTEVGDIVLSVKRTRTASACGIFSAYARRPAHVDRAILDCFLSGASTRKVGRIMAPLLGEQVSASPVSRIAKQLDRAWRPTTRGLGAHPIRGVHTRECQTGNRHPDSTDTNLVTLPCAGKGRFPNFRHVPCGAGLPSEPRGAGALPTPDRWRRRGKAFLPGKTLGRGEGSQGSPPDGAGGCAWDGTAPPC